MNKGMLTVGIILLSLIALLLINVLTNYSTGSELDYYLVKETVDASMKDSLDDVFLRECGLHRIDKERFVESFLYRFANSVDNTRDYDISFYDINEVPPKVSVKVDSKTVLSFNITGGSEKGAKKKADITTSYSAILETNSISDIAVEQGLNQSEKGSLTYDQCRALVELNGNGAA